MQYLLTQEEFDKHDQTKLENQIREKIKSECYIAIDDILKRRKVPMSAIQYDQNLNDFMVEVIEAIKTIAKPKEQPKTSPH